MSLSSVISHIPLISSTQGYNVSYIQPPRPLEHYVPKFYRQYDKVPKVIAPYEDPSDTQKPTSLPEQKPTNNSRNPPTSYMELSSPDPYSLVRSTICTALPVLFDGYMKYMSYHAAQAIYQTASFAYQPYFQTATTIPMITAPPNTINGSANSFTTQPSFFSPNSASSSGLNTTIDYADQISLATSSTTADASVKPVPTYKTQHVKLYSHPTELQRKRLQIMIALRRQKASVAPMAARLTREQSFIYDHHAFPSQPTIRSTVSTKPLVLSQYVHNVGIHNAFSG